MEALTCKRCGEEITVATTNSIKRKYHSRCWSQVFYDWLETEEGLRPSWPASDNAKKLSEIDEAIKQTRAQVQTQVKQTLRSCEASPSDSRA